MKLSKRQLKKIIREAIIKEQKRIILPTVRKLYGSYKDSDDEDCFLNINLWMDKALDMGMEPMELVSALQSMADEVKKEYSF
tara:strand:+ start:212 stop:457 length:246 start_codon:yes stop_codon:yes gene_type:complete